MANPVLFQLRLHVAEIGFQTTLSAFRGFTLLPRVSQQRFFSRRSRLLYQKLDEDLLTKDLKAMANAAMDSSYEVHTDGHLKGLDLKKDSALREAYSLLEEDMSFTEDSISDIMGNAKAAKADLNEIFGRSNTHTRSFERNHNPSYSFPSDHDSFNFPIPNSRKLEDNEPLEPPNDPKRRIFVGSLSEAERLRDKRERHLLWEKKLQWLKLQGLPNPAKDAKKLRKTQKAATSGDSSPFDIAIMNDDPGLHAKFDALTEAATTQEVESRLRSKIREEKLANSTLMNASIPKFGGRIIDPLRYHRERRRIRLNRLLQAQLEEFLTLNSPKILNHVLGGAAVSITKLEMATTRSACNAFYTFSSEHSPEDVQRRLDAAAPIFRFQLARRLKLGFTPPIQFIPQSETLIMNKQRLRRVSNMNIK